MFDQALDIFAENAGSKRKRTYTAKSDALLKSIIVCGGCESAVSPTYTKKKNKQYRYYITNSYRQHTCEECTVSRIPAGEIEELIKSQLKAIFASPKILVKVWRSMRKHNKNF